MPNTDHEARRLILDALAALTGHTLELPGLPDGRRPDVARIDGGRQSVFLGDAKDTETPWCSATQARLLGYLRWLTAAVAGGDRVGVFAVCFGPRADVTGWRAVLESLSIEAGLRTVTVYDVQLARRLSCVWVTAGGCPATPLPRTGTAV